MSTAVRQVAALFVRADSIYHTLPGVDCYDMARDARTWPGGCPGIFHPPCRAWGVLRQFAKPRDDEKDLALWAVERVRLNGGVLEHPAGSTLWPVAELPEPGARDAWGGWTLVVHQHWFGHRAEKATRLYIVGCEPEDIPTIPLRLDKPTHCIRPTKAYPRLPSVTKAEREKTPEPFARWLAELARRCVAPVERWYPGTLRYRREDGSVVITSPRDPYYSVATMLATEFWSDRAGSWKAIEA